MFKNDLREMDRLMKELQPVQIVNSADFNLILLDQCDEKSVVSANRLFNNYRWYTKLTETISCTTLNIYKRFQTSYAERKSSKYRSYGVKGLKKE
jgi:hypothetical protein